jgi:hypothetical protein
MGIRIEWTKEKKKAVLQIIEDFIIEHDIICPESACQRDNPQIYAPQMVAEIVEILEPIDDEE